VLLNIIASRQSDWVAEQNVSEPLLRSIRGWNPVVGLSFSNCSPVRAAVRNIKSKSGLVPCECVPFRHRVVRSRLRKPHFKCHSTENGGVNLPIGQMYGMSNSDRLYMLSIWRCLASKLSYLSCAKTGATGESCRSRHRGSAETFIGRGTALQA
jgi:hypothetical protein